MIGIESRRGSFGQGPGSRANNLLRKPLGRHLQASCLQMPLALFRPLHYERPRTLIEVKDLDQPAQNPLRRDLCSAQPLQASIEEVL